MVRGYSYLDEFVISTCDEIFAVPRNVNGVDRTCGALHISDRLTRDFVIVPNFSVSSNGQQMVLIWVVAETAEQSVRSDHC